MATGWENITDVGGILRVANDNTGSYFWVGMLFMIYIVLIISMLGFGIETAILASSFAALIIGLIMVSLGLVSWVYVASFVGVIIMLILWISYTRPKY